MKVRWAGLVVLLAGCEVKDPDPGDYNRQCFSEAECVTVRAGDPCKCDCVWGAVHETEKARWQENQLKAEQACDVPVDCNYTTCWTPEVNCEAEVCQVEPWESTSY